MSNLSLIPIRESDRMGDEMLSFITAGTAPIMPMCMSNTCQNNSGTCAKTNSCGSNSGDCGDNGCRVNYPGGGQKPPCPNDCPSNFAPPPCTGVTNS